METIVFLHGALGSSAQFESIILELKDNYHCVAFNFPFHGNDQQVNQKLNHIPWSIQSFTDHFIDYIEVHFQEKISVFGYSMGGYIALYAASLKPSLFKNIMTLGTKFKWDEQIAEKEISLLNPERMEQKIPAFVETLKHRHPFIEWKELISQTVSILKDLGKHNLLTRERLSLIESKVLLCRGDQDETVSIEETQETLNCLRQGKLTIFPDTKHPFEKTDQATLKNQLIDFFNY